MELINQYLPGWQSYIVLVLASSLTAWVVTMAVKRFGTDYFDSKGGERPFWWRSGLRACAALVGLGVGLGIELSFAAGIIGLLSGAMSSLIVMLIKKRLAKVVPEAEHFSGTFSMTVPVDFDKDKLAADVKKAQEQRQKEKAKAAAAKAAPKVELSETLEADREDMLEMAQESAESNEADEKPSEGS